MYSTHTHTHIYIYGFFCWLCFFVVGCFGVCVYVLGCVFFFFFFFWGGGVVGFFGVVFRGDFIQHYAKLLSPVTEMAFVVDL